MGTAAGPRECAGGFDREDRRVEGPEAWSRADAAARRVTGGVDPEARPREEDREDGPRAGVGPSAGVRSLAAGEVSSPDEDGAPDEVDPSSGGVPDGGDSPLGGVSDGGDSSTGEEPGELDCAEGS